MKDTVRLFCLSYAEPLSDRACTGKGMATRTFLGSVSMPTATETWTALHPCPLLGVLMFLLQNAAVLQAKRRRREAALLPPTLWLGLQGEGGGGGGGGRSS